MEKFFDNSNSGWSALNVKNIPKREERIYERGDREMIVKSNRNNNFLLEPANAAMHGPHSLVRCGNSAHPFG